eukprot:11303234-Ditylum_brightwellii.AAC.1
MHQPSHHKQQQSLSRNMIFNIPFTMTKNTSDFEPTPFPPFYQHQNVATSGAPHNSFNKKCAATNPLPSQPLL